MKQQMEMGFDLMGPLVKSPDGNTYKLVGVATATGVGGLWACQTRLQTRCSRE